MRLSPRSHCQASRPCDQCCTGVAPRLTSRQALWTAYSLARGALTNGALSVGREGARPRRPALRWGALGSWRWRRVVAVARLLAPTQTSDRASRLADNRALACETCMATSAATSIPGGETLLALVQAAPRHAAPRAGTGWRSGRHGPATGHRALHSRGQQSRPTDQGMDLATQRLWRNQPLCFSSCPTRSHVATATPVVAQKRRSSTRPSPSTGRASESAWRTRGACPDSSPESSSST